MNGHIERNTMSLKSFQFALLTGLSIATLLATSGTALANDAVFGGSGASISPIKEKRLRMASESIVIREKPGSKAWGGARHWDIEATYRFENPTKESITTQFGFPESTCDEDSDCNSMDDSKYTFHNMKTTVEGKKVKVTQGTVDQDNPWGRELGRVHLFDVTIPAQKTVEVVHHYQMGKSGSVMADDWVMYITRTGALWNGPIGSAKFTIEVLERPWGFSYPADYNLTTFETSKDGKLTTIAFEMKDWTPKQDLDVVLGSTLAETASCPSVEMASWKFYDEGSSEPKVDAVEAAFSGKSTDDVRRCRNMVYAAHGYSFKDKKLQDFFYKYSTPVAVEKTEGFWGYYDSHNGSGPFKAVVFAPDANYSPSHLSELETKWVKALKALEKKRKSEEKGQKKKK